MEEGKLPIDILEQIISQSKTNQKGVIQGPKVGCDVAVVDYHKAIEDTKKFYSSSENVYLVTKTDPITFPTPNPGRYAVIVNSNDVVTSGAIPYGFNATILLPVGATNHAILKIQEGIQKTCDEMNIAVLGGHTEFTSSVNVPIVSGAMIGFVPKDYYVSRVIQEGDVMLCIDWCAKEGMGIIATEGYEILKNHFSEKILKDLEKLGSNISIAKTALKINRDFQPNLMHDPTEGGVLGAAYETIIPEGFGLELYSKEIPLTKETQKVCDFLKVDPFRLISSGALLAVTSEEKAKQLHKQSTDQLPIKIIGKIVTKENGAQLDGEPLAPPGPDVIIEALRKIEEGKF